MEKRNVLPAGILNLIFKYIKSTKEITKLFKDLLVFSDENIIGFENLKLVNTIVGDKWDDLIINIIPTYTITNNILKITSVFCIAGNEDDCIQIIFSGTIKINYICPEVGHYIYDHNSQPKCFVYKLKNYYKWLYILNVDNIVKNINN